MKNNLFSEQHWGDPAESQPDGMKLFERLSAYFDGEATPEECRQIQALLDTDPAVKRQYLHLHQLRQGLQVMPVPDSESHHWLAQRVFARLHRTQAKVISLWGSGAIAALFIAGVVSQMPRLNQPEMADLPALNPSPTIVNPTPITNPEEEALVVALNRPVLQIPKLATATPVDTP